MEQTWQWVMNTCGWYHSLMGKIIFWQSTWDTPPLWWDSEFGTTTNPQMIPSEGYVFHWQTNSMKSVKCTPTSEKQVEQPLRKDMQLEQEYRWYVSLYTKFFFISWSPWLLFCKFTYAYFYCSQAKQVHVKLDDRNISPPEGFLLRKGEPIV